MTTEEASIPSEICEPLSVDLSPVHTSALIHPQDSPIENSLGDLTVIEPVRFVPLDLELLLYCESKKSQNGVL